MIALMWIRLYVLPNAFQMPMILLKDASVSGQIECLREHAYSSSDALSNIWPVRADICRQHAEARARPGHATLYRPSRRSGPAGLSAEAVFLPDCDSGGTSL